MNERSSILRITQDIFLKHTSRVGKVLIVLGVLPSKCDFPLSKPTLSNLLTKFSLIFFYQGLGGILVRKIEGDYNNVVGFPAASFFKLLDLLVDEDPDFLDL